MIAHASPGESAIAAVVHATGGVPYLLALVTAGLAITGHRRRATLIVLFGAAVAVAATFGMLGSPVAPRLVGLLAALATGLCVAINTRVRAGLVQAVVIGFGGCYGLLQGHHLSHDGHQGGNTLAGMLVATAGAYLLGAVTSQIVDETDARTPVSVALGAATAATAAGSLFTL